MEKVKQTKSELIVQLSEQINYLINSCNLYDNGERIEAKNLAHRVRVLLHDTKQSKSALGQLGLKDIHFLNTAHPYDPDNLVSSVGLLTFRFNNSAGRRPWVAPKGTPENPPKKKLLKFSDWWNMTVVVARTKTGVINFCRRDLIWFPANQDGGSHVDPKLAKKYMALSRWNAVGIQTIQNGVEKSIENPVFPCIRQIVHELLLTLHKKVPECFLKPYTYDKISDHAGTQDATGIPTESQLVFAIIE